MEYGAGYKNHYLNITKTYPSVLALKLFLGNNPEFTMRNVDLENKKILDLGFGDGRDLSLFTTLGLDVYGVEVLSEVVSHTQKQFDQIDANVTLKQGVSVRTGFEKDFFDIVYAAGSVYYLLDENAHIRQALSHVQEVLKKDGLFLGSLARSGTHVVKGSEKIDKNRIVLKDSFYKVREGQYYHVYNTMDEVKEDFDACGFDIISLTESDVNWFGTNESLYFFVAKKR